MYPPTQNLNDLTGRSAPGRRSCKGRTPDLARQVAQLRADLEHFRSTDPPSAQAFEDLTNLVTELVSTDSRPEEKTMKKSNSYTIYRDMRGVYRWRLKAPNGRTRAAKGEHSPNT